MNYNKLKKLERLINQRKQERFKGAHIIENGLCSMCEGECKFLNKEDVIIVYDDVVSCGGVNNE